MVTTPNRIKELRKQNGLTLKQLSHQSGISVSSLSAYEKEEGEKGYRAPKIDKWIKLANCLNVSVPYLQGLSNNQTSGSMSESSVATVISTIFNILIYERRHTETMSLPSNILNGLRLNSYEDARLTDIVTWIINILGIGASIEDFDNKVKEYSTKVISYYEEQGLLNKEASSDDVLDIINNFYLLTRQDGLDNIDNKFIIKETSESIDGVIEQLNDRLFGSDWFLTKSGRNYYRISDRLPKNVDEGTYQSIIKLLKNVQRELNNLR